MKKFFVLAMLFLSLFARGQTYNPSLHTLSNKSLGIAQAVPTDARSYYYDAALFIYRPYQSTAEVLTYLNLSKFRVGHFPIFVSSGVLQPGGTFTGGTISEYWFKAGTNNSDLVVKAGVTDALAVRISDTASMLSPYARVTEIPTDNIQLLNGADYLDSVRASLRYYPLNSNPLNYAQNNLVLHLSNVTEYVDGSKVWYKAQAYDNGLTVDWSNDRTWADLRKVRMVVNDTMSVETLQAVMNRGFISTVKPRFTGSGITYFDGNKVAIGTHFTPQEDFHLHGSQSMMSRFVGTPGLQFLAANGDSTTPTVKTAGQVLAVISAYGYKGTGDWQTSAGRATGASISFVADSTHSSTVSATNIFLNGNRGFANQLNRLFGTYSNGSSWAGGAAPLQLSTATGAVLTIGPQEARLNMLEIKKSARSASWYIIDTLAIHNNGLSEQSPVRNVGTSFTVVPGDKTILYTGSGSSDVATLPSAVTYAKYEFEIVKTSNNIYSLTVIAVAGNIDGSPSIQLKSLEGFKFKSDGANWYRIGKTDVPFLPFATAEGFGAVADGITDDTAPLIAAFNTGKQVVLRSNTTYFAPDLKAYTGVINLRGGGVNSVIKGNGSGTLFSANSNHVIQDVTFDNHSYLFRTFNASDTANNITLSRVRFKNGIAAIQFDIGRKAYNIRVDDCTFDSAHYGVYISTDSAAYNTMEYSKFTNIQKVGVFIAKVATTPHSYRQNRISNNNFRFIGPYSLSGWGEVHAAIGFGDFTKINYNTVDSVWDNASYHESEALYIKGNNTEMIGNTVKDGGLGDAAINSKNKNSLVVSWDNLLNIEYGFNNLILNNTVTVSRNYWLTQPTARTIGGIFNTSPHTAIKNNKLNGYLLFGIATNANGGEVSGNTMIYNDSVPFNGITMSNLALGISSKGSVIENNTINSLRGTTALGGSRGIKFTANLDTAIGNLSYSLENARIAGNTISNVQNSLILEGYRSSGLLTVSKMKVIGNTFTNAMNAVTLISNVGNSGNNAVFNSIDFHNNTIIKVDTAFQFNGSSGNYGTISFFGNTLDSITSQKYYNLALISRMTMFDRSSSTAFQTNGDIIPTTNNLNDLGTSALAYRAMYAGSINSATGNNFSIGAATNIKFFNGVNQTGQFTSSTGELIIQNGGTFTATPTSQLTLVSTTRGSIPAPKMTKTQRDQIVSPAQGLVVFVTDGTGYLSWYNSGWQKVNSISDP